VTRHQHPGSDLIDAPCRGTVEVVRTTRCKSM